MTSGVSDSGSGGLPTAQAFAPGGAEKTGGDTERNIVFGSLVTADSDIVGLVAYSIYKQNKHDWLVAFEKTLGRGPSDDEAHAYIIGESTPRRLSTYRHLAQATLDGNGPEVATGPASESFAQRSYSIAQRNKSAVAAGGPSGLIKPIAWGIVALIVLAAIFLATRYGLPTGGAKS